MSIFHTQAFADLHGATRLTCGDASITFLRKEDGWYSPGRGTFGGFSMGATPEQMAELLEQAERLEGHKIVTLRPQKHSGPHHDDSWIALRQAGYRVAYADLNYSVDVTDKPLVERMNRAKRREYKRGIDAGLATTACDALGWLHLIILLLQKNRASEGRKLSMDAYAINRQWELAGIVPLCFVTKSGDDIRAVAVCFDIGNGAVLIWAWADIGTQSSVSPTVVLANDIYEWCQRNQLNILDAGISSVGGVRNGGLCAFKSALGFEENPQTIMVKNATR